MVFFQKSQIVLCTAVLLSALSFAADNKGKISDAECKSKTAQVKQNALACLDIADPAKRRECMDKAGKSLPEGFDQACKSFVEPAKEEIKSKEAKKYPNQGPGMDGKGGDRKDHGANKPNDNRGPENKGPDNRGPENKGPDNRGPENKGPDNRGPENKGPDHKGGDMKGQAPKISDAECKSKTAQAKQNALACLDTADAEKRRACMDKAGKSLPEGFDQACKSFVEPAKEEIKSKEAKKYPNQPPSMDNNKGGSH